MDVHQLEQELQQQAQLTLQQAEQAAQVALAFVATHVPGGAAPLQQGGGAQALAQHLSGFLNR